jgi:hypothetical protein
VIGPDMMGFLLIVRLGLGGRGPCPARRGRRAWNAVGFLGWIKGLGWLLANQQVPVVRRDDASMR